MPNTDSELIQRAREIAPRIRARAAEAAVRRKPHDDSIQELIETGIVQMFVPKRWGGAEASLSTALEVIEIISEACPSTGWIAAFYIMHNIYVPKFPERAHEELFGKKGYVLLPAASAPNMKARKVDGGWELSGLALWGSGVMHADWVMIGGMAEDGQQRGFLLPVAQVQVEDNWHFAGMSGTGSNDYVATNVFVPDHCSAAMGEFYEGPTAGSRLYDNPLYSIPFFVLVYCTFAPVIVGCLKGALRAYEETVERRVRNFTGAVVKEQQHAQIMLGEFQIATRAADELARAVYGHAAEILAGRPFTVDERLKLKGLTAFISKHSRETVNAMMGASGASSFHNDQALQRIWRDLNTVSVHAFVDWDATRELHGKHHLGLPLTYPLF